MKQVRMAAAELLRTVHPERVVPDDPAPAAEPQVSEGHLQFSREIVPDRQPEGAARLQDAMDFLAPFSAPCQVVVGILAVVINVVIIADVEGWVGKDQVNAARLDLGESLKAIALKQGIRFHDKILLFSTRYKKVMRNSSTEMRVKS